MYPGNTMAKMIIFKSSLFLPAVVVAQHYKQFDDWQKIRRPALCEAYLEKLSSLPDAFSQEELRFVIERMRLVPYREF